MFTKEEPKAITWLKLPASTNDSSSFQNPNQKFETDDLFPILEKHVRTLELKHKNETRLISIGLVKPVSPPGISAMNSKGGPM